MAISQVCSIPDCGKRHKAHGWCAMHYGRWRKHGDINGGATPKGDAMRFYREVALVYDGDECLIWPYSRNVGGYGTMRYGGRKRIVPRLVCIETNGEPPTSKHAAAHSCGKGHEGCVAKRHLSWKTAVGNAADMVIHGTRLIGDRRWNAKLNAEKVRQIRASRGIVTQPRLAIQFGVSLGAIRDIMNRKTWASV